MREYFAMALSVSAAMGVVAAFSHHSKTVQLSDRPALAPFEFHISAAQDPETAARALFRGLSQESPKHFVQHLLLGVCDGSIDTLQKFAESLHRTEFHNEGDAFTLYDLRESRRGINPKEAPSIVAIAEFNRNDKQVSALRTEMVSTYYGEKFFALDVASTGYDGLKYQTRVVVAQLDGGWYAMPRCRSAKSFYRIADRMDLVPVVAE